MLVKQNENRPCRAPIQWRHFNDLGSAGGHTSSENHECSTTMHFHIEVVRLYWNAATGSRFIYRHGSVGPPPRNRLRVNRSNAVRLSNSCRHSSIGRQSKEQQLSTDCEWTECRWTTGCGPRLVIRNKSRCPIALPASVFDQTNCTAQDLLQRVVSETLKCFAGCCFCGDQLYGPKLVTKNES